MIEAKKLDEVLGCELIDVEHKETDSEGTDELVFHFSSGKEISVYRFQDGRVLVEGD